jgi:hypothetical protein
MSLDYNLADVKDRDTSDEGWRVTQNVIFSTMFVDMGEITEANAAEFHARLVMFYRVAGDDLSVTPADVAAHIGLKTNVITKTRTQFLTALKTGIGRELDRLASQARREIDKQKQEVAA